MTPALPPELRESIRAIHTYAENPETKLEFQRTAGGTWYEAELPLSPKDFDIIRFIWRIKPAPKLVPWTGLQGLGKVVRAGHWPEGDCAIISRMEDGLFNIAGHGSVSPSGLLDGDWQWHDGQEWKPCGEVQA